MAGEVTWDTGGIFYFFSLKWNYNNSIKAFIQGGTMTLDQGKGHMATPSIKS